MLRPRVGDLVVWEVLDDCIMCGGKGNCSACTCGCIELLIAVDHRPHSYTLCTVAMTFDGRSYDLPIPKDSVPTFESGSFILVRPGEGDG